MVFVLEGGEELLLEVGLLLDLEDEFQLGQLKLWNRYSDYVTTLCCFAHLFLLLL